MVRNPTEARGPHLQISEMPTRPGELFWRALIECVGNSGTRQLHCQVPTWFGTYFSSTTETLPREQLAKVNDVNSPIGPKVCQ